MERDELIKKIMNTAEYYKDGKLYATGAMTDIGIFIDEYIESKFKNNGGLAGVSGSFQIERRGKKLEILNYYDKTIEISVEEYSNEIGAMLDEKETKALIDWLNSNCR